MLDKLRLTPDKVRALTGRKPVAMPQVGPPAALEAWLVAQGAKITGRVSSCLVEVTPTLAAAWLVFNTKNRNPSRAKIRRFAAAMQAGRWTLTGESVKFSAGGRLLDGQSRLMAIQAAGVPVVLEVRGGLADGAQETMDTGEAREHRHQLEMLGEKNPNEVAAALRLLWFYEQTGLASGAGGSGQRGTITNTTIREMLEKHAAIRESVGRTLNLKQLLPVSAAAFLHYLFARVDAKRADAFMDRLTTGANLGATSPIYLLRERLMQDRLAPAKMRKRERLALAVKAWNAYRNGKTLPRLVFSPAEEFPAIVGLAGGKGGDNAATK